VKFRVVIPARYASSRFPGKPLADIGGRPMVVRVCERAAQSGASEVHVATDDERIAAAVRAAGYSALRTRADHASGTDRIAEAAQALRLEEGETVVNLQGDEPLMPPELIREVAGKLAARKDAMVATACHAIRDRESLVNPNVVKVVCDAEGYALYFSRAAIPWPREVMARQSGVAIQAYRHIGLYAYRAGFVRRYASWPPCPLEEAEQLEQLRVLWHGERIVVHEARAMPEAGVDTPEDLERVRKYFEATDKHR